MSPGAVIVDLAGDSGGNCELTEARTTVTSDNGVKVISPVNLPSEMSAHASQLYAKNIENLLGLLVDEEGALTLNFDDEVIAGACLTHEGKITNERAAGAETTPAESSASRPGSSGSDGGSGSAEPESETAAELSGGTQGEES